MKQALSIFFTSIILFSSLLRVGVLINFKVNQDFIEKVLCINKDKPKMSCKGKCFLNKQLKKITQENKEESPLPKRDKDREMPVYVFFSVASQSRTNASQLKKRLFEHYVPFIGATFVKEVFHPPKNTSQPSV